jgi:AraC-like DNA-binding protein
MSISGVGRPRGLLNRKAGEEKFELSRFQPSPELSPFVLRYWVVRWDLNGQPPHVQENLPYPCVNLVFEQDNTHVYGVISRKYAQKIENKGQVFGVKFRPGGFYPFWKTPLRQLTDRSLSFQEAFGVDGKPLEQAILALEDEDAMIALAEAFLRERLPEPDANVAVITRLVDCIVDDRSITKVDDLLRRFSISKRSLQRLFSQYVGVTPKWVIRQYRLHEAAEQLAAGHVPNWPRLAVELGYFDQAHFIKDFKNIVGLTPAEYARHMGM